MSKAITLKTQAINLRHKFSLFNDQWAPKVIAELNDCQLKLVRIHGEFVWHSHADTDEMFLVVEGEVRIELRDVGCVYLKAGELYVVPKGVKHRPVAKSECLLMLIERRGTVNTGTAGGSMTAISDVWI